MSETLEGKEHGDVKLRQPDEALSALFLASPEYECACRVENNKKDEGEQSKKKDLRVRGNGNERKQRNVVRVFTRRLKVRLIVV